MNFIIFDLEATCWKTKTHLERQEVIEIGAVKIAQSTRATIDEFDRFVRPTLEPVLSAFCVRLTSIQQHQVDTAESFPLVFGDFCRWIGEKPFKLCSWGAYDFRQLVVECQRRDLPFPFTAEEHLNLKEEYASCFQTRPCGMLGALGKLGLTLEGTHHRGLDDARNIAKIAQSLLWK